MLHKVGHASMNFLRPKWWILGMIRPLQFLFSIKHNVNAAIGLFAFNSLNFRARSCLIISPIVLALLIFCTYMLNFLLGSWLFVTRSTMEKFAGTVSNLAQRLAEILAEELGHKSTFFMENCLPSTCYLRMNRYPPCPISPDVFGLMPHTDSDFLTILHQDEVGGLQLVKDGEWIAVKPNPDALIINIGDLFQVHVCLFLFSLSIMSTFDCCVFEKHCELWSFEIGSLHQERRHVGRTLWVGL